MVPFYFQALELLAKITLILACSCSRHFYKCSHGRILMYNAQLLKSRCSPKTFATARMLAKKKKHPARLLASAHQDQSKPLKYKLQRHNFPMFKNNYASFWHRFLGRIYLLTPVLLRSCCCCTLTLTLNLKWPVCHAGVWWVPCSLLDIRTTYRLWVLRCVSPFIIISNECSFGWIPTCANIVLTCSLADSTRNGCRNWTGQRLWISHRYDNSGISRLFLRINYLISYKLV